MPKTKGTINLDRNLIDTDLWDAPAEYLKVWLCILMRVAYMPTGGLAAGQWVFRWEANRIPRITHDQWKRAIALLRSRGAITLKPVRQGVLITVRNWAKYQCHAAEKQLPLWFPAFASAWADRSGGNLHPKACKDLAQLVEEHGDQAVLANWKNYLAAVEPRFLSAQKFAETFGSWAHAQKETHGRTKRTRQNLAGHAGTTDYSAFDRPQDE